MNRYIDFDGTLAEYHGWKGIEHTGKPVPQMIKKVKQYLAQGDEVTIFTARLTDSSAYKTGEKAVPIIQAWCQTHLGKILPVTNIKGPAEVIEDDRAVQIVQNTGLTLSEFLATIIAQELATNNSKEQSLNRILEVMKAIEGGIVR